MYFASLSIASWGFLGLAGYQFLASLYMTKHCATAIVISLCAFTRCLSTSELRSTTVDLRWVYFM
jgi:hypothetical protein